MTPNTEVDEGRGQVIDESGDYGACRYCGEVWPNEMLRADKRMPEHRFGNFLALCAGSGEFPVAPTVNQIRQALADSIEGE